ncbi:MAG: SpaA isopeptide-forming pilin-related protein, partial [Oscillospiraceae bacterium]|nr:SpaA isopeptide-forming pilin-related protein [Oscillospiraceae bacterium]
MKTIKTNFKLALSLALILTLTLQLFVGVPLDFSAQAAVTGSFISAVNIVNISVYSGGSEIKNGDAIPPDLMASNMSLLIDFVIPPDKLTAIHDSPNKTYEIALPAGLSWGTNLPRNIGGSFDGVYLEFAKLNASGSNLQVIFDDTLSYWTNAAYGYYDGDEIENGWIEVNVQFDATAIGEKYAYQITLTPDKVLNLYFDQHKPSTMFLGKTGNYKDNRFEWNITYVTGKIEATGPNSRDPELPVTFTDTFDPRVHTLILESLPHFNSSGFNDMETGIIYEHAGVVVNTTATATTITYTTDSPDNWGYETRISDDKLNTATATENITATNEVKVFEKDNPTALRTETASVTVGAAHRQWMGKVGKQIGREMEWTITINTNDRYLTNLVLYDKLPPGMTLVSGSITVSPTPVGTGFAINETPGGTFPNDYSFRVIFPPRGEPTSPVYASVYTVTYRTKIADTYFDNPTVGGFDSSNNAWIDFDWRYWTYGPGPGSPITFTRPSISKPSGAVTNVIQKNAMGYDRATGKITWRVTVNPHKINIASGTITDNFAALTIEHNPNNNKQTYAGGFTVQGGDTRISTTTANGASTLTVTVGAIGTDTLWFEFDTYVGVADHARNTPINRRFDNVVSFSGVLAGGTPESPILIPTTTASAWLTTTSQMMTKIGTTVTYNTTTQNPEITWTIVVNQNKMNLTGATIVDVLPLGLTYVPGSITGGGVTASASGQTLTITLPNGTETHTITYRTAIDPTNLELANAFKTTNNIDITNSATLVLGGDFSTVSPTAAATQKVANPRLNKTRITPSPVGEYNYRVDVNVNGVILNPTGVLPADRDVLIDESPPGLRLDIESVQLVRATVNANGTLSPISGDANIWKFDDIWYLYDCGDCAGCDEDDEDCTDQKEMKIFDFSDYPANFKVNLPSDNARDRYILTYTCVVAPGITVPLKNKINFAWEDIEVDDNSDTLVIGSGGGGSSNRLATITLTLQDSMRPDVKLSNVEFEVWRNIAGVEILEMTVKTGTNGQVTLYPLSPNADYTLKQVSYPDGYVADSLRYHSHNNGSGAVTVTPNNATTPTDSEMTIRVTARASDANNPTTITVTNAPATASFSFTARSDEVINIASPSGIFLPLGENQANFTARLTHVNGAATTSSTVSSVILTNLPTNASGVVTFADLPHGTYTITQNNTLQTNGVNSHTQPTSFTVIVNRDGTVTMPATPYYANNVFFRPSITVNKTGLGASDTVTFQLWDTTNSPAVQVATQTRTGNGSVIFNGLLGGHSYEIREINTIATYYQSGTHTISKINSATNLPNVAWTNYPHSASITVTLRDGDRNAILLVGNFELYDENDNMIDSGTSTGGTLTFNNLPMTQTSPYTINSAPNVLSTGYYLIQTSSPDGYTPHPDPIPVSLSTTYNTNTPVIVNNAPIKINTTLTFVKESEMGGTIAGVEFQLSDTH